MGSNKKRFIKKRPQREVSLEVLQAQHTALHAALLKAAKHQNQFVGTLLSSLLLPLVFDILIIRNPMFGDVYSQLAEYAGDFFERQVGPAVKQVAMLRADFLNGLSAEEIHKLDLHLAGIESLSHREAENYFNYMYIPMKQALLEILSSSPEKSGLAKGAFQLKYQATSLHFLMSLTVLHIHNRSKFYEIVPHTLILQVMTHIANLFGVRQVTNYYFPRGIFPLVKFKASQAALLNEPQLQSEIRHLRQSLDWVSRVNLGVSGLSVGYFIYLILQAMSFEDEENIDIKAIKMALNLCQSPMFLMFLWIGLGGLLQGGRYLYHKVSYESALAERKQSLQSITSIFEPVCDVQITAYDEGRFDRSIFMLAFSANDQSFPMKDVLSAFAQFYESVLPVISISDNALLIGADFTPVQLIDEYSPASFGSYLDKLIVLLNQKAAIKAQLNTVLSTSTLQYQLSTFKNDSGNPQFAASFSGLFGEVLHESSLSTMQFDRRICLVLSDRLNENELRILQAQLRKYLLENTGYQMAEQPLIVERVERSCRSTSRNRRYKADQQVVMTSPSDPEVKSEPVYFYNESRDKALGIQAMHGYGVKKDTFFAYYDAEIADPGLADKFRDIIHGGRVVGPQGQGIKFVTEDNLFVKENGQRISPNFKVKPSGTYGAYRLFGRIVETREQKNLVAFRVAMQTHH